MVLDILEICFEHLRYEFLFIINYFVSCALQTEINYCRLLNLSLCFLYFLKLLRIRNTLSISSYAISNADISMINNYTFISTWKISDPSDAINVYYIQNDWFSWLLKSSNKGPAFIVQINMCTFQARKDMFVFYGQKCNWLCN